MSLFSVCGTILLRENGNQLNSVTVFVRKESRAHVEMTLESSLPSFFSFLSENFSSPNFSAAVCVCGASAWEAMLSFEGSCVAMLALYGALMLLVKLLSAIGMVKSLLRQEKPKSRKPEAQEPVMNAVASSGAGASSSAAAASAAAGEPAGVVNTATSEILSGHE